MEKADLLICPSNRNSDHITMYADAQVDLRLGGTKCTHAHSDDSDQTARMWR